MLNLNNTLSEFIEETIAFIHFNIINYVSIKKSLKKFYTKKYVFIMKWNHSDADIYISIKLITSRYSIIII